jgi:hypothetical protein
VDYKASHKAPSEEFAPLHDLTKNGVYPTDVYGSNGARYYGSEGGSTRDRQLLSKIASYKDKPEALVEIHRAVPEDVKHSEIHHGDWVTIEKKYAKEHGESALDGRFKIISKKVPAHHIHTNGDSLHEWGYNPPKKSSK